MKESGSDEKTLIAKAQRGDAEAFGILYDRHLPQIYRFIFFKVTNRHDAEDICHHVFLSAWQNIGSYKDIGYSFSSWVYRIARNAVVDFYRTQKTTIDISEISHMLPDTSDIEKDVGALLSFERVIDAISDLNEDQREVLVMRYIEELDNKEIAQITGKSNGAIRILQHRALKNLKQSLAQNDAPETDPADAKPGMIPESE